MKQKNVTIVLQGHGRRFVIQRPSGLGQHYRGYYEAHGNIIHRYTTNPDDFRQRRRDARNVPMTFVSRQRLVRIAKSLVPDSEVKAAREERECQNITA